METVLQRWQYTQRVRREYQALGEGQVVVGVAGFAAMAQALTRVMGLFTAAPSQTGSLGYAYLSPYLPQRGWHPKLGATTSLAPIHGGPLHILTSENKVWPYLQDRKEL